MSKMFHLTIDQFNTIAYLDPGAGSILMQLVIGGGAGLFVFLKQLVRILRYRQASVSPSAPHGDALAKSVQG